MEIAKAIAEKLGVEAEFVGTKWDSIIAGLDAKRYDAVINPYCKTHFLRF